MPSCDHATSAITRRPHRLAAVRGHRDDSAIAIRTPRERARARAPRHGLAFAACWASWLASLTAFCAAWMSLA